MQYPRIVLNEPHASIEGLYDEHLSFWNIDENFVNDIVQKWTDWHTDFLFHGYRKETIRTVRFPYSRFIVDAERLWNDPLEAEGPKQSSQVISERIFHLILSPFRRMPPYLEGSFRCVFDIRVEQFYTGFPLRTVLVQVP